MSTSTEASKAKLTQAPLTPAGVKYALTVPQSVLFADLSLQGNKREYFVEAMDIDYEPAYIAIDAGGAMSWNYDNDKDFNNAFLLERNIDDAVSSFIATMGKTSRKLDRRSVLGSTSTRRQSNANDLLDDLNEFWHAYKLHMTSLFTFWNVESLLGQTIIDGLHVAGLSAEGTDFDKLVKSTETNQFVRERRCFEKIVNRFVGNKAVSTDTASPELIAALEHHVREFSFLLTPFNLGNKPSVKALLQRVNEVRGQPTKKDQELSKVPSPTARLKKLTELLQQLTFWKNERLDVLSMADARMELLYKEAAEVLGISLNDLFAMTSDEITESLEKNKIVAGKKTINERQKAYCLILSGGNVNFYLSSPKQEKETTAPQATAGTKLYGVIASGGKVSGNVRVIESDDDLKALRSNDILVTSMTRPEYGTALDRAAAFVTDEGGMLCHAAIISREMKKPCIINTEFGTKLLRTGMQITVDAQQGFVIIDKL